MIKKYLACFLVLLITACGKQNQETTVKTYFDVATYFKKEAERLNKLKKPIEKTVTINGSDESKKLLIKDWEKELAPFIDGDINKISWKGLFKVTETPEQLLYTSDDDKVNVKQLRIERTAKDIRHIFMIVERSNMVYTSIDTLDYFPMDWYNINKTQKIKLLDEKKYNIKGRF